jgi:hypothetical protein
MLNLLAFSAKQVLISSTTPGVVKLEKYREGIRQGKRFAAHGKEPRLFTG